MKNKAKKNAEYAAMESSEVDTKYIPKVPYIVQLMRKQKERINATEVQQDNADKF